MIVSGGHTHLVIVKDYGEFEILGRTRDDAAGEAFDKIARVLGLGYPGGPLVEKMAAQGNEKAFNFPRVNFKDSTYDFSFSGLKTAVINVVNQYRQKNKELPVADICASFQKAAVDVLVEHTMAAAKQAGAENVCIAGGVAANNFLRKSFEIACSNANIQLFYPPIKLCTDNAAMIASSAYFSYIENEFAPLNLNAVPNLKLGEKRF